MFKIRLYLTNDMYRDNKFRLLTSHFQVNHSQANPSVLDVTS